VTKEDGKNYFNRFFCALGLCIIGFRDGCMLYLSVDSTAINGRWNVHLTSATSVDGHNWMYPLAFGFFQSETIDNWRWFLSQLKKAVGDLSALAICSDAISFLQWWSSSQFQRYLRSCRWQCRHTAQPPWTSSPQHCPRYVPP
jgi:hypothetical protein